MKPLPFLFALLLGVIPVIAPRAAESPSGLWAGTAKVEITPPEADAVNLAGQPLRLRDPLYARVLVLKDSRTSVAIVSADLIVFASSKVIAEVKRQWGVDHVLLCATHTHAAMAPRGLHIKPPAAPDWTRNPNGPSTTVNWLKLSDDPWYAATEAKVVAAVGKAMQSLFPARLVAGRGPYDSAYMAHNRREVRPDRVLPMWENPNRRPTQAVDPTVGVVSRDYPGAMVDHLEQELGSDCMAMFLQGASGDLDPYDLHNLRGENRFNIVRQNGIALGKAALRLAAGLKVPATSAQPVIQVKESLLTIPHRSGPQSTEVGLLTVVIQRELALVAIPGEPFVQHQLDLTAKSPVPNAFVLGLAYSGRGTPFTVYLPTVQAVKEGGYGAAECSFLAADAGERLVNEALQSIRQLLPGTKPAQ